MDDKDRSRLNELYPKAKTYDELEQIHADRVTLFESRLPRFAPIKIGVLGGVVYAFLTLFMQQLETMWFYGGFAFIFISFLIAIVLLGLGAWWVKMTQDLFYRLTKNSIPFFILTGSIAFTGIIVWITGVLADPDMILWPAILGLLFTILIILLASFALKTPEK